MGFEWTEEPDMGEFVEFAWTPPYQEGALLAVDLSVPSASFASPPGFSAAGRVNGTGRLPYVSALPGWSTSATVTFPANLDRYEVEVVWSTNSPFGYGCGDVSTVAHRPVLERRRPRHDRTEGGARWLPSKHRAVGPYSRRDASD
jgi:hypothetical protein